MRSGSPIGVQEGFGRVLTVTLVLLAAPSCSDDTADPTTATTPALTTGDSSTGEPTSSTSEPTSTGSSEPTTEGPAVTCGDGVRDGDEECDDGNVSNEDYCLESCKLAVCGDSYVQVGIEQCDDGNDSNEDNCTAGCYDAICGDGYTYAGSEQCDDGNFEAGDGCDADCVTETALCGNGMLEGDEACDDGNTDNTDSCLEGCVPYSCGDGWQHAVFEECDDGNPDNSDDCVEIDGQCLNATCGDGIVHTGDEDCDDANDDDSDDCVACAAAECGDGSVQAGVEICDDGENQGGYASCAPGCTGLGPHCSDGTIDDGFETCDDGNLIAGDGCDATCQAELPPECLGYVVLAEPERAFTFNDGPGKVTKCDTKTNDLWHRFMNPAGTVMPLVAPSVYSCGTDAPGWMIGNLPTFEEEIVPRTACFAWFGDSCAWQSEMLVRNCGDYYVFKLPNPPDSCLRYCAAPAP